MFILYLTNAPAQEKDFNFEFSDYTGDYLGLNEPGTVPVKFAPGFISFKGESNMCIVFSADGKQLAYTINDLDLKNFKNMYARQIKGRWTKPVELKFPQYKYYVNPFFSADGKRIIFTKCDDEVYQYFYTELGDSTYSDLVELQFDQLDGENIFGYTMDKDSVFYFCGKRDDLVGGNTDIYKSYRKDNCIVFENQRHLNDTLDDDSPLLSPDGKYLLYNQFSNLTDSTVDSHIMVSRRLENGNWSNPYNLGKFLNLKEMNWGPFITHDHKYLFLSINSPTGFDIYWVSAKIVEQLITEN